MYNHKVVLMFRCVMDCSCGIVKKEFRDMYLSELEKAKKDRCVSYLPPEVVAMVRAFIEIKKEINPELAETLTDVKEVKMLKNYLLSEFKLFVDIPNELKPRFFAEYAMYCLLDYNQGQEYVDIDWLKSELQKVYDSLPEDEKTSFEVVRSAFRWSNLVA